MALPTIAETTPPPKPTIIKKQEFVVPILFKKKVAGKISVSWHFSTMCKDEFALYYPKIKDQIMIDTIAMGYLFWPVEDPASFIKGLQVRIQEYFDKTYPKSCKNQINYNSILIR